jgi:hypothetical protein
LLATAASAHFLNTRHALRELARRGDRRICLVIDRTTDRRWGSNVLDGCLVEQQLDDLLVPVPGFFDYEPVPARLPDCAKSCAPMFASTAWMRSSPRTIVRGNRG